MLGSVTALAKCLCWCGWLELLGKRDRASSVSAAMERARYLVLWLCRCGVGDGVEGLVLVERLEWSVR